MNLNLSIISIIFVVTSLFSCSSGTKQDCVSTNGTVPSVETLRKQYAYARSLQGEKKYDEAIQAFKICLNVEAKEQSPCDSIQPIVTEAMMQLMNTYQSMGKPDECADYLDSLRRYSSTFIRQYCLRDLYSITAYALSRTDRMNQAEQLVDSALALPLYKPTPERLFRDYAYAAAVCFSNPGRQEEVIAWSRKAQE